MGIEDMVSPVFPRGDRWYFEGEYHEEGFDTEAEALTAARAYDKAARERSANSEILRRA
jgi:hypothetical protein